MNAAYIDDAHKGKVNSMITVLNTVATLLAIGATSYLVSRHDSVTLSILIVLSLLLSLLPYIFFLDHRELRSDTSFVEVYRFLIGTDFRENIVPFAMETFWIVERICIPLYIFIVVGDFQMTSTVIAVPIVLEFFTTIVFGLHIDAFARQAFLTSTALKSFTSLLFPLIGSNLVGIFIAQSYGRITDNLFGNSFCTLIQKKAKRYPPILFVTAEEMALCFTEFFALSAFAFIAYFVGDRIFLAIFLMSFVGVWTMYCYWRH